MPVKFPILLELDRNTWLIDQGGGECAYALLGGERGLLIDCRSQGEYLADRLFGGRGYSEIATAGSGLHTGEALDLGGREIACVSTYAGMSAFCDGQSALAFTGRSLSEELSVDTVSDALVGLMRLRRSVAGASALFPARLATGDYRGLPFAVLDDAVGACRAALSPEAKQYERGGSTVFGRVSLTFRQLRRPCESPSPYPLGI